MRQARNCWPALVKKATDEVNQTHTELAAAMARVDQLNASHQRLCRLYDEYRLKEQQPQTEFMGMQASMNQRQFMAQLLNLQHRVVLDISKAETQVTNLRKRRQLAEMELQKMRALEEQDLLAVRRDQQKYEQRQMDELGVRQFNLRMQN
ncbi:MAG: flagellar FliJ family protein [Limnohabitans sp.]|nr:flagellar FliJ family protein [Limnohabitans sp.]